MACHGRRPSHPAAPWAEAVLCDRAIRRCSPVQYIGPWRQANVCPAARICRVRRLGDEGDWTRAEEPTRRGGHGWFGRSLMCRRWCPTARACGIDTVTGWRLWASLLAAGGGAMGYLV